MKIKTINKGRSHLRKVLADGEIASWFTIIDYQMRIGSARVKMGGIAAVATKKKHRKKGYMRALMEDSIQYMKDKGYDVSVVMGIPDFYYRFGYVSCMPFYMLSIPTKFAEELGKKKKYRIRRFQRKDSGEVLRIYNSNNQERTCSLIRKKKHFSGFPKKFQEIFVVEDNRRNMAAYFILKKSDKEVLVLELGAKSEDAFGTLLSRVAQRAIKRKANKVDLFLPPDHPFADLCRRCDCRFTTEYHKNRGYLMRIINQDSLLKKMEAEFSKRLSLSPFKNYSGSLEIRTDSGSSAVKISRGTVKVYPDKKAKDFLKLSQGQLAQLIIGYRSVSDVLLDANARASKGARALADALFPKSIPYTWDKSRFENPRILPEDQKDSEERVPVYENQFMIDF